MNKVGTRAPLRGEFCFILCAFVFTSACGLALAAERGTLEAVLETATGRRAYADYWGLSPVREIDPEPGANLLGTMMALGEGGTSLDMRLIVGLVGAEAHGFPQDMNGSISADVCSSTNELDRKSVFGRLEGTLLFDSEKPSHRAITVAKHASQRLDAERTLFIYELNLKIPLRKQIHEIPEFISIMASFGNELNVWKYVRRTIPFDERPGRLPLSSTPPAPLITNAPGGGVRRSSAGSPGFSQSSQTAPDAPSPSRPTTNPVPDVRISVVRDGDFLIITCSPHVDRALLEQADLTSSPLEWRPLQTGSNQTRWYVPPDDGARAFRIKIPR